VHEACHFAPQEKPARAQHLQSSVELHERAAGVHRDGRRRIEAVRVVSEDKPRQVEPLEPVPRGPAVTGFGPLNRTPPAANGAAAADIDVEDAAPILVTVEYEVIPEKTSEFLDAMHRFGRIRRRDGASSWGVFRDLEAAENRYLETFMVDSWAEHLRQHERLTQADREIEERVLSYTRSQPRVRHLVSAK